MHFVIDNHGVASGVYLLATLDFERDILLRNPSLTMLLIIKLIVIL